MECQRIASHMQDEVCQNELDDFGTRSNPNEQDYEQIKTQYDLRTLDIVAEYNWTESDTVSLLPVQLDQCPEPFVGRLVNTEKIDPAQISAWLQKCQTEHGELCKISETPAFEMLRPNILVVDVEDYCLRNLPENSRYIALSYVWGGIDQPKTKLANIKQFSTPRGLDKIAGHIPKAIVDAISVVKLLGERYLWVDAFCIVQDDNMSKQSMIDSMHIIYQNAFLTLFAATGSDANAGLPGVSSSRGVKQHVASISDELKFIFPIHYLGIKNSTWASRGWTYQEYFFSKRRLIFFGGQIVFQCNTVRWREDVAQEHLTRGITHYQINIGGDRMGWEPPGVHTRSNVWDRNRYEECLETYIDRSLSQEEDILNAFAGIISAAAEHGLQTFHGLSCQHFAMDLLWLPCRWLARRSGFPSWSWAGWKGPVITYKQWPDYPSAQIWSQRMSWIQFHSFDKDSQSFRLLASGYSPKREREVLKEEAQKKMREDDRDEKNLSKTEDFLKAWDGKIDSGRVLTPLLARLSLETTETTAANLSQPSLETQLSGIDQTTLLFRTMTAMISISGLTPNGRKSKAPRNDEPLLPSAPSLYLYTKDGTHIGTAWVYSEEIYRQIVLTTSEPESVSDVEIAVIAGPVRADWRTREENPPEKQIMNELILAGGNARDIIGRHMPRARYHTEIGQIFLEMIKERHPHTYAVVPIEMLKLDILFWRDLEARVRHLNFPGHNKEAFEDFVDQLMNTNSHMRESFQVRYFRVLLIGNLGGEILGGTGKATQVFGKGEIREDALGLIDGLCFRDILLK